jgi:hypothetical protein
MLAAGSHAYALRHYTFAELFHEADSVIIGKATSRRMVAGETIVTVSVEITLKGKRHAKLELFPENGIAEMHTDCCVTGASYLLFLVRTPKGPYEITDGHFGAYKLDDDR